MDTKEASEQHSHDTPAESRRRRRLPWLNQLVAILVLVGLVCLSLALFGFHTRWVGGVAAGTGGPTPTAAQAEAGGLDSSMHLTAGPYFLSELVVVDLRLTNTSTTTYELEGPAQPGPCGSALNVSLSGGNGPQYTFPFNGGFYSCPGPLPTPLAPNHTLTLQQFLPLSSSGKVTLTAGAQFLRITRATNGGENITSGPSPLDGHWPTLHISVASTVPVDRQIMLWQQGGLVEVIAPVSAHTKLYYFYTIRCDAPGGGSASTGNFAWKPLATSLLREPVCPDVGDYNLRWNFAVSAPGYAIASR